MLKKYWKIILIIVIVLATVGVYFKYYHQSSSQTAENNINPQMVMEVKQGNLARTISAEGFIEPVDQEDLTFPSRTGGSVKVKKIYIKEGDRVEKGQLLMELDKSEARLNYLQKQNAYNRAKINGSKNEIEEARLNLELASDQLDNLDLTAPFAGIVTDIYLEEGSYYNSGTAATIKDTSQLKVEVSIEESDIPIVKVGQKVNITLESLPGRKLTGKVVELGNEANNDNTIVTLPVTVILDQTDEDIKLGVSAKLEIIVGEVSDKIIVPITAVVNHNGSDAVVKVVNGKPQTVPVKTGLSNGLQVAVESGLQPGDKILTNAFQQAQGFGANQGRQGMPGAFMGRAR